MTAKEEELDFMQSLATRQYGDKNAPRVIIKRPEQVPEKPNTVSLYQAGEILQERSLARSNVPALLPTRAASMPNPMTRTRPNQYSQSRPNTYSRSSF
jgi:hypothetical protein